MEEYGTVHKIGFKGKKMLVREMSDSTVMEFDIERISDFKYTPMKRPYNISYFLDWLILIFSTFLGERSTADYDDSYYQNDSKIAFKYRKLFKAPQMNESICFQTELSDYELDMIRKYLKNSGS